MNQKIMYQTTVGDKTTALTVAFVAGTDETIWVEDSSFFPDAPNTVTIRKIDKSDLVTVKYTGKTRTSLTGVSVLQGDSERALTSTYPIGSDVSKPLTQDDIQTMQDNIRDVATAFESVATTAEFEEHVNDRSNPHVVTKDQVGLGNVDNTSDADKPVSTETLKALAKKADSEHANQHGYLGDDAINLDASQIVSGTLSLDRIPRSAIERVIVVSDDEARYALTSDDVDNGDIVKVISTSLMWSVVDTQQLSSDAGYILFTAAADWSNITNKPLVYTPGSHAKQHSVGGGDPITPASIGASLENHTHTPSEIGAAPAIHLHTPDEIGAAPVGHTHTPVELGAADRNHTHTPSDIGAAPANHSHTLDDLGAASKNHTHTPSEIGAAPANHKSRHTQGGVDALTPSDIGAALADHTHTVADIGAAGRDHAERHASNGDDPITPASIGAATVGHSHSAYANKIHAPSHATGGDDPISPSDIGAATAGHTHTEYALATHSGTHNAGSSDPITPEGIGAAAEMHSHTPDECDAAPVEHSHKGSDLTDAVDGTSIIVNSSGKLEATAGPQPTAEGVSYDNTDTGLEADTVQAAIDAIAGAAGYQVQADWTQTDDTQVSFIRNKPSTYAPTKHKSSHSMGGEDALTPSDIGAATAGHTHTEFSPSIHADQHKTGGKDAIEPSDIGAALANHSHTPASIGAADANHTHLPEDVGAAPEEHTHTSGDLLPAMDGVTINVNSDGKFEAKVSHHNSTHGTEGSDPITPADIGAADISHTHSGSDISTDGVTIIVNESGQLTALYKDQTQADWEESVPTAPGYIKNKPLIGSSAEKDVAVSGDASVDQVVLGNDSRLTDDRYPTNHKTTHAIDGEDALTPSDIGAASEGHVHTKDQVGLGNVDNTSDADKPLSDAMQTALAGKADATDIVDIVRGLVPLVDVVVPTSKWSSQTEPDVSEFPYRAEIEYNGVTEDHFVVVAFSQSDAASGQFANVCKSSDSVVYIYAKEPPSEITIQSIVASRVVV